MERLEATLRMDVEGGAENDEVSKGEEEAVEGIETALGMEVNGVGEGEGEGEEGGVGTQRALGALEFLTQDADPSGTTLVDARNGFNELRRLEILWTVRHRWSAGAKIVFNCYRNWYQLLLRQPG